MRKTRLKELRNTLEKVGILMLTDRFLPSLTTIVAGEAVKGSWWGHPNGNLMYNLSNELLDSPDILAIKFINKKITFIPKSQWSAIVTIGNSQASWQMIGLSAEDKKLLQLVKSEGSIRADDPRLKKSATELGKTASKLEERMLVISESVHTTSGKHIRILKSWDHVIRSRKFKPKKISPEKAMSALDAFAEQLADTYQTKVKLPWI
jgi:hypothetical protein